MPLRAHATISQKITRIVMITCSLVIVLTLLVSLSLQSMTYRNSMVDKMSTLAKIIGKNSHKSLTLRKSFIATPILATLKTEQTIQVAYLINQHHKVFAHYLNRDRTTFAQELKSTPFEPELLKVAMKQKRTVHQFTDHKLCIYSPIYDGDIYLGAVYLQAGQDELLRNLILFTLAALIILSVAIAIAYLMSAKLRLLITQPLHQLVDRMKVITGEKVYSVDMGKELNNDIVEVEELLTGFNDMLHQINKRELALQKHSEELESLVAERTVDLKQSNDELVTTVKKLGLARNEAIEASAAKSRFLANMSHEIRTPMIGVLGMAELLEKSAADSTQKELAKTIHSSGESLLNILNDLLDISKVEAGKLELESTPFNPTSTLESSVELLADNAHNKGLELTTIPDPELPLSLYGDSGRLRQIILNLLSNAIKFTDKGRISVSLSCHEINATTTSLKLKVSDSGIGLSDQAKKEIFNAFTQADSSTTRKYGGTGLGLTIVKQLTELMDGTVQIDDAIPHGTCFRLTIPFKNNKACPSPSSQRTNKTVLIATGNLDLSTMLELHLNKLAAKADHVRSGTELVQQLTDASISYDLVFIDNSLFSAPESLLELDHHYRQKIIYISPHSQTLCNKEKNRFGVLACLTRPVQTAALYQLLQSEQTLTNPKESSPAEAANKRRRSDKKILLAEDNLTNQRLVQLILEQDGYQLTIVNNGQQAIDAMNNDTFDLILMDCQMPVMDGYKASIIIRETSTTPIIALTAHASEENTKACLEAGMDAYLCKPYRQKELLDRVEEYLTNTIPPSEER